MARRRKPITKKPTNILPNTQQGGHSSVPAAIHTNEPPTKGRLWQAAKRLTDSGIDFLLDNFWWGVIFMMTSITITISLYIQSGRAVWLYPYLYFALGFITAGLMLIAMYGLLFYVQTRRRKELEQAKNLKFISQEKGFLDHLENKDKAIVEANAILIMVGKEIAGIGMTLASSTDKFNSLGVDIVKRRKLASRTAAKVIKHAEKMEQYVIKLEQATDLLNESTAGVLQWYLSQQTPSEQELIGVRQSYEDQIEQMEPVLASITAYHNGQEALIRMKMSQDINTSMSRLSSATKDTIEIIRAVRNNLHEQLTAIDKKLT